MPRKSSFGAGVPAVVLAGADLLPVSSSGAGVVSATLSGTDRAGTKRGIKCIGAEPDKNSRALQPARIKRARRYVDLPRRNSAADRERDQEILSEIPLGLPAEKVAAGQHKASTRKGWHRTRGPRSQNADAPAYTLYTCICAYAQTQECSHRRLHLKS